MITLPQEYFLLSKPLLLTERTEETPGPLQPSPSAPDLHSPSWMSFVPTQMCSKSLRTRQALTVSLQYPDTPALSKHPKTSHQGSRWMLPFPTGGNLQYLSAVLLFLLMFGSGLAGSDASPDSLYHAHLFPGHHTCSATAALQAEKETSLLLPEITRFQTFPSCDWFPVDLLFLPWWYKVGSPPLRTPFLTQLLSQSPPPTRWPHHPQAQGKALNT